MGKLVKDISYGRITLPCVLPDQSTVITSRQVQTGVTPEIFGAKIDQALTENVFDLASPVVVVADKTRLCGYPEYLPILLEKLVEAGAEKENISCIIAYGTHPDQSDEESVAAYGKSYHEYSFLHHSSDDKEQFEELGTTSRGTPIRVRKDLLAASCVITFGAICHHYFAGYGGGRKLLFPGCGETSSIYRNHALFLDNERGQLSPYCMPGNLANNPIAEDIFEIDDTFHADLAIHGIMDMHGSLCDVVLGFDRGGFLEACDKHAANFEIGCDDFDTVIVSSGGHPKDINFIQAHKAIHNGSMFVKDGGELIVYCECADGVGSMTFLPWFEYGGFDKAFAALKKDYQGNGGTALSMMSKTSRIRISLVTDLDLKTCEKIGVTKLSPGEVGNMLKDSSKSVAYIPNCSLVVKA